MLRGGDGRGRQREWDGVADSGDAPYVGGEEGYTLALFKSPSGGGLTKMGSVTF